MAAAKSYNKNNAGVRRIMREAAELSSDSSSDYLAQPLENDIFEWHCTMKGPAATEFEGGLYHFRIILPAEYPFRPPSIIMLTPSGRFECGTKICISFTNYHEELWQPAWGVRTAIIALQGFFPLKGEAAMGLGAVEYPESERRRLAVLSREWICPDCKQCNKELMTTKVGGEDGDIVVADVESVRDDDRETEPKNSRPAVTPQYETSTAAPEDTPVPNNVPSRPAASHSVQRSASHTPSQPPLILDAAIGTLLFLVAALLLRRLL